MGWRDKSELVLTAATSVGAFGELVEVRPAEGEAFELRGIWDNDHTEFAGEMEANVSQLGPVLSVRESDLPAPLVASNDRVVVRDTLYVIADIQPDGQGTQDLLLNELDEQP